MISVSQALSQVTGLVSTTGVEHVPLIEAAGRVLAEDVRAGRDQPPFAASAMDGYALKNAEVAAGRCFTVIGESAAGARYTGRVDPGETVRIFTGAPMPEGADRVIIQEDVTRYENVITISTDFDNATYVRPKGNDFAADFTLRAPRRLSAHDIALLAAMNAATVPVRRQPVVALLATGDELVMPGEQPGMDQIITSNNFGLAALLSTHGAKTRLLPIARDTVASLTQALGLCDGADLIVTLGGASVGDHDIVHQVASDQGLKTAFYKVAMRPGKPLMAGKLRDIPMVGLPGNPVSSMVCGHIFLRPALNVMLGFKAAPLAREPAVLDGTLARNGGREHYMRARISTANGALSVRPEPRQDSALLSVLAQANALLVREPDAAPATSGDLVDIIRL